MDSTHDSPTPRRVLVVDDETHMLETLRFILEPGYRVRTASDGETALKLASESSPHAVLLDLVLPGLSGIEVLQRLKRFAPETEVIMVTAINDVRKAVEAMKAGAFDYITKPFEEEDLLVALEKAVAKTILNREVVSLRREVASAFGWEDMVGASPVMEDLVRRIRKVASQDVNVLVTGESGTGKELIARAIHYQGIRSCGPFVPVNCACFGSDLTESELFGHVKGAFTGAASQHRGKFEQADGGTLFLDEIGAMPFEVQSKLLRVLETRRVTRLGGEKDIDVDLRIIAATNVDLLASVGDGRFREDLYYRLKVVQIVAPPLRERREDIPELVEYFLRKHRRAVAGPARSFAPDAMEILKNHPWRGNVRELENVVLTLMCMADGETIEAKDLEAPILDPRPRAVGERHLTRGELLSSLEANGWNLSAAARSLGVHRNTVRNLMDRLGIERLPGEMP